MTIDQVRQDIITQINLVNGDSDQNLVNFLIVLTTSTNNFDNFYNNNIFGIRTDVVWGGGLSNYIINQNCGRVNGQNIPYVSFENYLEGVRFMVDRYKIYFSIFDE